MSDNNSIYQQMIQADYNSKRFELAKAAMQGILSNATLNIGGFNSDSVVNASVKIADEMIKQLNKNTDDNNL